MALVALENFVTLGKTYFLISKLSPDVDDSFAYIFITIIRFTTSLYYVQGVSFNFSTPLIPVSFANIKIL